MTAGIGLDNGLVPMRHQAIIWTNSDPIYWRICATLGEEDLTVLTVKKNISNSCLPNIAHLCPSPNVLSEIPSSPII